MPNTGSAVVRRQLGRQLRRLRDAAGKTDADVTAASLASKTKLWRLETGKIPIKIGDVRALCWFYGVDQKTTDRLAALAVGTSVQGWWEDFGDVLPDGFGLYIGLESIATKMFIYHPELVPGLLQTPDYIRSLVKSVQEKPADALAGRQIELRRARQQALITRVPPLELTVVLNHAVIARTVGSKAIMTEQRDLVREMSKRNNVDIRVVPWDAGAHAAMHIGSFTILDFDTPDDPAVVYIEAHNTAIYLETPDEVAEYRRIADRILEQSQPFEDHLP